MRVNLAAQTPNHLVATDINTMGALKHLPEEATMTSEYIDIFDQIFYSFNIPRQLALTSTKLQPVKIFSIFHFGIPAFDFCQNYTQWKIQLYHVQLVYRYLASCSLLCF